MQEKIVIRKKALINRKNKYFEVSEQFFKPLLVLINKKKKNISLSLYYPANYEVNVLKLFKLLKKKNIKTLLPVTKSKNEMKFVEWQYLDPLQVNKFGMLDPCHKVESSMPDIMLVPLLAFDPQNNRLGYGKGFYDKYLSRFSLKKKHITTIGLSYSFQKVNELPTNKYDVKLNFVITEKDIF